MTKIRSADWDPRAPAVLRDQVSAYDDMRRRCPVAYSDFFGWSIFRHADIARVVHDPEVFSNVVSKYRSVPNGMDPPEHTAYRRALEPLFEPERMREFEPVCRRIAADLLGSLPDAGTVDVIAAFAEPFSVRCQCAFLGWPDALVEPLRLWTRSNAEATLAGDRSALAALAREFRSYVDELLASRRGGGERPSDVTSGLMAIQVNGAPLTDEELTSIFRNWTVGEVGSLTAAIGIVAHGLACRSALQERVRADISLLPAAIEELLRITGPLVLNRRVATRDVEIAGRRIAAGERVSLIWVAGNRDPEAFEGAEEVRLDRDLRGSWLFGAGLHVCPGAPLARLELRVAFEELLRRSRRIELDRDGPARPAVYPSNGWASLGIRTTQG